MTTEERTGDSSDVLWYDLFSRGTRDWLRHNEKVQDAVRRRAADLANEPDVLSGGGDRKVEVPVRFLEHYRFRLRNPEEQEGVGQGEAEPGDVLRQGKPSEGQGKGSGGNEEGGLEFVLEFRVDEIVDWLWEQLELPDLKPKAENIEEEEYQREGWDKRGARSRLDRRRSLKESLKRRAVQPEGPAFTNEDLRYRQLARRPKPSTQAVVLFVLDASSSVSERERKLAKTFFFWALQGLRRQYRKIETAFVAHTVQAWEFPEEEFFQVTAQGGTVASTGLGKALEVIEERYDPSRYNVYLFYASDGENFRDDREPAANILRRLTAICNFMGYVETGWDAPPRPTTETMRLFDELAGARHPVASYPVSEEEHVWAAIRHFFRRQVDEGEAVTV